MCESKGKERRREFKEREIYRNKWNTCKYPCKVDLGLGLATVARNHSFQSFLHDD